MQIPVEPENCTPGGGDARCGGPFGQICGGQTYRPFLLRGENIGVFGDKSSLIRSEGRGYGIIAEGNRLYIQNVMVRGSTDPGDNNSWLCLIPIAGAIPVAFRMAAEFWCVRPICTVMDSDIAGGVAGIAAERVRGLKLSITVWMIRAAGVQ